MKSLITAVKTDSETMILISTLKHQLNSKFDIVISDLNLDGKISGKDLVRYIRQELRLDKKALPILPATGSSTDELNYAKLHTLGVNDFLSKPAEEEILRARMEPWVLIERNLQQSP